MKRCFVSLEIPWHVREKIKNIQDSLPPFKGKKIKTENIHLTLKFLGEISDEKIEEVKRALSKIDFKRFDVGIDDIGVFSKNHIRIVWLYLSNCQELQKKVDEVLSGVGFVKERRFMSHVTIARVKGLKLSRRDFLERLEEISLPKISFKVEKFSLVKSELFSEGPKYGVLENYSLG